MNPHDCILFSGGTAGAEAEFGAQAEGLGIDEVNFSFEGHQITRQRGRRLLNETELLKGDMGLNYISEQMGRTYSQTPAFRRVLQSIWHQVSNGESVFVIGRILPDGTVKGGTGWGAELAKLCYKTLHVFDQDRDQWFFWDKKEWKEGGKPVIADTRFTGTGTRFLEDNGRQAIAALFARSFPPADAQIA